MVPDLSYRSRWYFPSHQSAARFSTSGLKAMIVSLPGGNKSKYCLPAAFGLNHFVEV